MTVDSRTRVADIAAALPQLHGAIAGLAAPGCRTVRGLYHGLEALEREMHVHVHLENNVLFPRALRLAGAH